MIEPDVPFEFLYGIDTAIKKLRPGASFGLDGLNIVDWNDPNELEPPTKEEIQAQIAADKAAHDKWAAENNADTIIYSEPIIDNTQKKTQLKT